MATTTFRRTLLRRILNPGTTATDYLGRLTTSTWTPTAVRSSPGTSRLRCGDAERVHRHPRVTDRLPGDRSRHHHGGGADTARRREHRREQHGDVPADDQRLDGVHRRRRLPGEAHEPWTANVVLTEADGSDAYLDLIISQVTTQIELDLDDDFEPAGGDPDETIFVQGTIGSRLYVPRRVRVLTVGVTRACPGR